MSSYEQYRTSTIDQKEYVINAGWDAVLNRFFLVIEDETDPDSEGPFYSNLDDTELDESPEKYQNLDYFRDKLKSFGLDMSEEDWTKMAKDKEEATTRDWS